MKWVITFIFAMASVTAQAFELTFESGQSWWNKPRDTVWWQPKAYSYDADFEGGYLRLGGTNRVHEYASVNVFGFSLGDYKLVADASSDEHKYVEGKCPADCVAPYRYVTSGRILGLGLSTTFHTSDRQLGFELGVTGYRQDFKLHVSDPKTGSEIYSFQEHALSHGYVAGIRYQPNRHYVGCNLWHGQAQRKFNNKEFNAGSGKTVGTCGIGFNF